MKPTLRKTLLSTAMCVALALLATDLPALSQTTSPNSEIKNGTVSFYSIQLGAKQQVADAFVPFGNAPFGGLLYDGSQRVAHLRGGSFMTFLLPAGEHQFSASYGSLDPGDPAVHLKVEDGGYYCVRLSANYKSGSPFIPLGVVHGVIEQVPCDQALKEAGKYKPLELKRIDAAVRSKLVSSQSFPKHE